MLFDVTQAQHGERKPLIPDGDDRPLADVFTMAIDKLHVEKEPHEKVAGDVENVRSPTRAGTAPDSP